MVDPQVHGGAPYVDGRRRGDRVLLFHGRAVLRGYAEDLRRQAALYERAVEALGRLERPLLDLARTQTAPTTIPPPA